MKTYTKEQLDEIIKLHGMWLSSKIGGLSADLSNADLFNADLSNADLSNANLSNADLFNADLSNADLFNADLSNADLSNAKLSNADLFNAKLFNAKLSNADLSNADLSYAKTDKRYIQIACIGSRKGMTTYCFEDDKIWCGCYQGTLKEFEARVRETHKGNKQYLAEYLGWIKYVKSIAKFTNK